MNELPLWLRCLLIPVVAMVLTILGWAWIAFIVDGLPRRKP